MSAAAALIGLRNLHEKYCASLSPDKLDDEFAAMIEVIAASVAVPGEPSRYGSPDMQALILANLTAQPAVTVPPGMQLVPIEPTQAMLDYADKTVPTVFSIGDEYRAMLAAAPLAASPTKEPIA